MVEISNTDVDRILSCLDIAQEYYKSLKGMRNVNNARMVFLLKNKINRKINKQNSKTKQT
jgi:hypothetical protein